MMTDQEAKTARAYNIGYALSAHEPRLLEQIIRQNKKNEFVKVMSVARDHQEFDRGIPRNDYTTQFKNGFHNAKALIENDPRFFDHLVSSKGLDKNLKKGLVAGKKHHEILKTLNKVKKQPKLVPLKNKDDFQRGFNVGYELSRHHNDTLSFVIDGQKRYGAFVQGIAAGQKHYQDEKFTKLDTNTKEPVRELSDTEYFTLRAKADDLQEDTVEKLNFIKEQRAPNNLSPQTDPKVSSSDNVKNDNSGENKFRLPYWLKKAEEINHDENKKEDKDKDIEPEI